LDRNRCQLLGFHKRECPFPKDASYQIWLKSVQWFWSSLLNEKFTDNGWTGSDQYSSLQRLAQVSYKVDIWTLPYTISSAGLGPGELITSLSRLIFVTKKIDLNIYIHRE